MPNRRRQENRLRCHAAGTAFHFYRVGGNFFTELRPLVPLLLESGGDIEICDESELTLMLSIAHLSPNADADLLRRAKRHLASGCLPDH